MAFCGFLSMCSAKPQNSFCGASSENDPGICVISPPAAESEVYPLPLGTAAGDPGPKAGKRGSINLNGRKIDVDAAYSIETAPFVEDGSTAASSPEKMRARPEEGSRSNPGPAKLVEIVEDQQRILDVLPHEVCLFGSDTVGDDKEVVIHPDWTEKTLTTSPANLGNVRDALANLGMAVSCQKGRKPQQPNQDNCFLCHLGNLTFCGVADGHGPDGHRVSHWIGRFVLYLLMVETSLLDGAPPGQDAVSNIFAFAHEALLWVSKRDKFDVDLSGSTLSVCIIDRKASIVSCAWCGDSRCTVGRGKGQAIELSTDHKPQDPRERSRIVASGGEVVKLPDDIPHRVFKKDGDTPGLAMSRAVGDLAGHECGVIHEPDWTTVKLEPDSFVLCCSDGVWEFLESQDATRLVATSGRSRISVTAERLVLKGRARWLAENPGMTDDISAIVIYV